jgi:endonuclease/exonuclease/phosphatase family metal-dependent hydrolase
MIPLLFACTPDEVPPGPDSGDATVLTYNVHGLPSVVTGDDTTARYEQIAPLLGGYDIVGIEEDWLADNHAILDAAAPQPTRYAFDTPMDDRAYASGLSFYGNFPAIEEQEVYYDTCFGTIDNASDCFASKGFLRVRLDLGTGPLDVYVTHLEAGGGPEDDTARAAQVDLLTAAIDATSADTAVVFMGDTNLDLGDPDDDPNLAKLADIGLVDACAATDCPDATHIDRIMLRNGGGLVLSFTSWSDEDAFYDADGVPLSDHPAIAAGLHWQRAAAP